MQSHEWKYMATFFYKLAPTMVFWAFYEEERGIGEVKTSTSLFLVEIMYKFMELNLSEGNFCIVTVGYSLVQVLRMQWWECI